WPTLEHSGRLAMGSLCVLLAVFYWISYACRTHYYDNYRDDSAFLVQAATTVPADKPLLVMDDDAPLNASWLLFYLQGRGTLLHNFTFLIQEDIPRGEVYLIARRKVANDLSHFGTFKTVMESEHSRYETTPADRYALFHVHVNDQLARLPGPVRIAPMQANS